MALARKDVTLPELVQLNEMRSRSQTTSEQGQPSAGLMKKIKKNLNVCLRDRERDYVSLQPFSQWRLPSSLIKSLISVCFALLSNGTSYPNTTRLE